MNDTSQPSGLIIRDAIPADVPQCITLDATYITDYVWQLNLQETIGQRTITLRQERLPRTMEVSLPPITEATLTHALKPNHAFLVAAAKETPTVYAYLLMSHDPFTHTATIRNILVGNSYRRAGLATRLLRVARRWATARNIPKLFAETQTKNYPSIQLLQKNGFSFCGYSDQHFDNQDIAVFFVLRVH